MLTIEEKELIWKMHQEGASIAEISKATERDRHTITNELKNGRPSLPTSTVSIKEFDEMQQNRERAKVRCLRLQPHLAKATN